MNWLGRLLRFKSAQEPQQEVAQPREERAWIFCATMQLRTPLRVLSRHGEVFDGPGDPPEIIRSRWEGIWMPALPGQTKFYGTMASDVGYVPADGGEYLQFLLAIRRIVEAPDASDASCTNLARELQNPRWAPWIERLHGEERIKMEFCRPFFDSLRGFNSRVTQSLFVAGLTAPADIAAVSDEDLLTLPGFERSVVERLREVCAACQDREHGMTLRPREWVRDEISMNNASDGRGA